VPQCSGYARFELQVDNIPHWEEDTVYGNGLLFEVQYRPDISCKVCLPIIGSYKGAVAPALYSTMSGVRCTDLLREYSTKERVTSPTLFILKVPFECPTIVVQPASLLVCIFEILFVQKEGHHSILCRAIPLWFFV
jgi:hypothetical protein